MISCPKCGREISSRPGSICPRCGYKVVLKVEKVCCPEPKCRALVSSKYLYCPKCGCKLRNPTLKEMLKMIECKIQDIFDDC